MTNLEIAREHGLGEMRREDVWGQPVYENAGAFAIMNLTTGEGQDAYDEVRRDQCCGTVEKTVTIGRETFLYTFDYGH